MKDEKSVLLEETLLLLELALIVGRISRFDLTSRCQEFLKILMARKNLSYGSVWIRSRALRRDDQSDAIELVYALPRSLLNVSKMPVSHPSMEVLGSGRYKVYRHEDPDFYKHALSRKLTAGTLVCFALGDIGVLRLHTHNTNSFVTREINQLGKVVETFTLSLEGALAEQRFRDEVAEREQIEQRLHQAERLKAVGQLTGGIAHDFNNLLAVIQGSAEFLELEPDHDEEMVGSILDATRRGSELTHRLLAYARQQPLKAESVDLSGLVCGMMTLLKRSLGQSISINFTTQDDQWFAFVDPRQLEDALLNLAINARDAMPDGGFLSIGCENLHITDDDLDAYADIGTGDYVVLSVTDTGTGIPQEIREKIFEPFFTTKSAGSGNGLGLSTIYGFAKQSGGHLSLYSEAGIGTTFRLHLPRADAPPESARAADDEPEIQLGNGERILVLDDDTAVLTLTTKTLTELNYRPVGVSDVDAARDAMAAGAPFDMLLSDVALPGRMSGPQFAEAARQDHPGLRILFMSGFPLDVTQRGGLLADGSNLINKPFKRRDLARRVHDALTRGLA